jgi:hypothetical protein
MMNCSLHGMLKILRRSKLFEGDNIHFYFQKFRLQNGDFDSEKAQIFLVPSINCLKEIVVLKQRKAKERIARKKYETKFYAAQAAAAAPAAAPAAAAPAAAPPLRLLCREEGCSTRKNTSLWCQGYCQSCATKHKIVNPNSNPTRTCIGMYMQIYR